MATEEKTAQGKEIGTITATVIGLAVWWFLASNPSPTALILAAMVVWYAFFVYCLIALYLPDPQQEAPVKNQQPPPHRPQLPPGKDSIVAELLL